MKKRILAAACATCLTLAGSVSAGMLTNNGTLEPGDDLWDDPINGASTQVLLDLFEFTVTLDGMYGFLSFYPGDTAADENIDGTLGLFVAPLDTASPPAPIASDDDYDAGDVPALAAVDAACTGSNCSGFEAALTAGTNYVLAQSSFTDAPTSFGQPTGPYEQTIIGPGDIRASGTTTPMPVPGVAALLMSGLFAVGLFRRRR